MRKALKGKTCFYITKLDDALEKEIKDMLDAGYKLYARISRLDAADSMASAPLNAADSSFFHGQLLPMLTEFDERGKKSLRDVLCRRGDLNPHR